MKCIYEGKDVFLWLPTGFGKSICYEILPFVFDVKLARMDSVVIVVSPLVSLMTDQTRSLRSRGVKAAIMSSMGGDTGLPHIYFSSIHSYLSFQCLRKTGFNDTERTPCIKKAPDLSKPLLPTHTGYYSITL